MNYIKVLLILAAIVSLISASIIMFGIKPILGEPLINYAISIVLIYNAIKCCLDAKEID